MEAIKMFGRKKNKRKFQTTSTVYTIENKEPHAY